MASLGLRLRLDCQGILNVVVVVVNITEGILRPERIEIRIVLGIKEIKIQWRIGGRIVVVNAADGIVLLRSRRRIVMEGEWTAAELQGRRG